jgi:phage terminase large subunit-like protein
MPENKIEELSARDGLPYDIFIKKGYITISGENYVDYRDVSKWFFYIRKKHDISFLYIGYDRWSSQYLIQDIKENGIFVDDVVQGENLAPVIREFEGIIKDKKFKICDNNLLKSHFLNVALKHNLETRKFRPVKIGPTKRIDGFVAAICAMTVRQKWYNNIGEMLKNLPRTE